ncbi:MAG TPA: FtsX-like permease family protein, partial [Candidatus Limnocylindrales bacterium]
MTRLALRLALSGGRGAAIGLGLTAFAVAVGTAILLFAISFLPALDDRAQRAAWRTSFVLSESGTSEGAGLLIRSDVDVYAGEPLVRVLVAGLIDAPPTPPGVDRLPGPGEAVVSPALAALLTSVPADQLGDRIGTVVGTIGDSGLRSPDELIAVIGLEPATLEALGATPITAFDPTPKAPDLPLMAVMMIVLAVIGALVPVAVFVSTATRLSAARREQRLAALRLVGATASQVTRLAAVEALFVSVIGVVAGIGLFFLTRPLVARIPLDAATWFPDAIVPPLVPAVAMLVVIPVVGVAASVVALRRVVVTPLGVQRRHTPGMPSVRRVVPLVVSVVLLPVSILVLRSQATQTLGLLLIGLAFGGVIIGIVLAGPWLTYLVGRALHALPGGASMLLASRRLTDDPRASFGAIAGVIMAVFVASIFFSFVAYAEDQDFDRAGVLAADQVYVEMPLNEGPPFAEVPGRIAAVPGVRSVLPIATGELMEDGPGPAWVAPCVDVARQFGLPASDCGTATVHSLLGAMDPRPGTYTLIPDRGDRRPVTLTIGDGDVATFDAREGPIAAGLTQLIIDPGALPAGSVVAPTRFYVTTDGSAVTGEQLRTAVLASVPTAYVRLAAESRATSRIFEEFGRVVGLGLIGTLVLAGCSLAVAVSTSVIERRRQFALLRSAGMPVSRLRALVLIQAGAPLIAVATLSAVLGIVVAQLILRLATVDAVPWPDPSLAITLGFSLVGAMSVVALMLPPLERMTRP